MMKLLKMIGIISHHVHITSGYLELTGTLEVCTGRAARRPGRAARKLNNLNGQGQAASKIIPKICI